MESKFKISPRILDHLGVAAYTSLKKCLAELCSNSYDADANNIWIELPAIFNSESKIIIRDDGNGMSADDLDKKYLFIGYDRREHGDLSPKKQRLIIGNKGIGKLAGFGVAKRVEITTVKENIQSHLILNKSYFDDFSTLNELELEIETKNIQESGGTTLILTDLTTSHKPLDQNELRQHLFKVLPNVPDFTIRVNDIPCSADDVQGEKAHIEHEFDGIGRIIGFYTIAKVRQKQPGIVIRVRKRAVTAPSLFGVEKRSHFSFSAEKIVGEIEADFLDPHINTVRDDFLSESEDVQIVQLYLKEYFEGIIDEIERKTEKLRTKKIIEVPDVREKLDKLPIHIRSKARKVIEGVVSKLKTASDEEVNELVDWIIRYFDSNVLREIMNSIMNSEIEDVEKLSLLIKDWGLKQINNVSEIIRDQIDIILKLEELMGSDKSLEIELHKLIEGNLWLVREGLELWSSDQPLKNVLNKHFDKIYKKKALERPDLVCRSRKEGHEAVILEFKKPSVTVQMKHVTQALSYQGVISKSRPNIEIETFVVGREYHSDVLAAKDNLSKIYLWSFSEILQRTRARFESILKILKED